MSKLLLILFAASFSHAAPTAQKITVCVPNFREEFLTLALLEARDRGDFKREGLDVDIRVVQSRQPATDANVRRDGKFPARMMQDHDVAERMAEQPAACQFGASVIERFLLNSQEVLPKTIPLLLSSYGQGYDTQLVVRKNSSIRHVRDLQGKRVRIGQPPVAMALGRMLNENGLTLADITQDYSVPATQVLAQLEQGKIDAAVTYVPTMPYMLASGKVRVLKANLVKSYLKTSVPHSLVIANRDFAQAQPQVVESFLRALAHTTDFLRRNPSAVVYTLAHHAEELGQPAWPIDKVTAEKAAVFVGEINTVNLFGSGHRAERDHALAAFMTYADLLRQAGFLQTPVSLEAWLNVPPTGKVSAL